ncbi:hypothetical protein PAALTS15_00830 [Paenibacillus alvei TS-15]|uniref:Uncharacterized protein n=1 Tax=Paenibacillus alvei TS-15 TaxID=1117108 RepID=S9UFC3_PAEAL|nr:hypothetical protein [Paenibacillus alvei]EPY09160.1 hypothetical protein PAALTS15_00830 [Paenibacillus alvei TS-15]
MINGGELAKVRSQYMNELYSRTDYSKEVKGISLESFYTLTRDDRKIYNPDLSSKFQEPFFKMMSDELKEMFLNDQSVKNTIKNIQDKGKALLKVAEEMNNK